MAWYKNIFNRKNKIRSLKRNYSGAQGGRLFADWKTSSNTADEEISGSLKILRNNQMNSLNSSNYLEWVRNSVRN